MTETDNVIPLPENNGEDSAQRPPSVKKTFRKIKVLESKDNQFYYIAQAKNGEPIYTSETFTRRASAVNAARREHEGRSERFDYILEYENAKGYLVRETL